MLILKQELAVARQLLLYLYFKYLNAVLSLCTFMCSYSNFPVKSHPNPPIPLSNSQSTCIKRSLTAAGYKYGASPTQ